MRTNSPSGFLYFISFKKKRTNVSGPLRFFVTGAYFGVDSKIDFYDQEAMLGMGGISFRWK